MPLQFLPRKSGPHRIACVALYRALLTHTAHIPLPTDLPSQGKIHPIKHVVRKEFRRYANHTSPGILVEVLKRGYAAEELLRGAANGDKQSLTKIHEYLWTLHKQRTIARETCLPPTPRPRPRVWPYPSAPASSSITQRPLPKEQLTGQRVIPKLATANGVPFLRFKKPGSAFLGRVLRNKADQKQRRVSVLEGLEVGVEMAGAEDEWVGRVRDAIEEVVGEDGEGWLKGREGRGYVERGWEREVLEVEKRVYIDGLKEQEKWAERGRVLAEVEEAERVLWERERGERRVEKRKARKERKAESLAKSDEECQVQSVVRRDS